MGGINRQSVKKQQFCLSTVESVACMLIFRIPRGHTLGLGFTENQVSSSLQSVYCCTYSYSKVLVMKQFQHVEVGMKGSVQYYLIHVSQSGVSPQ